MIREFVGLTLTCNLQKNVITNGPSSFKVQILLCKSVKVLTLAYNCNSNKTASVTADKNGNQTVFASRKDSNSNGIGRKCTIQLIIDQEGLVMNTLSLILTRNLKKIWLYDSIVF